MGRTEVGSDGDLSYLLAVGSPEQYVVRLRKAVEKYHLQGSNTRPLWTGLRPAGHRRRPARQRAGPYIDRRLSAVVQAVDGDVNGLIIQSYGSWPVDAGGEAQG